MTRTALRTTLVLGVAIASLTGCRGGRTEDTPVVPIRNMYNQPRYDAQEHSSFFQDGRTMRPQVAGTVSREMDPSLPVATGRSDDNTEWVLQVPPPVVQRNGGGADFVARGQERYNIYCAPCHGENGDGQGPVAHRVETLGVGAMIPPTFHEERLRAIPDGQLFATISNGIRNMPAYSHNIPVDDRWAIVSYVRALQLSEQGRPAPAGE